MIFDEPLIKPCGDKAFRVTFGEERTLQVNRLVRGMDQLLKDSFIEGILEIVPTYASLTVMYEPGRIDQGYLISKLNDTARAAMKSSEIKTQGRFLTVPICYEGDFAPDMDYICEYTGLNRDYVIHIHTLEPYYTFQLGFTPGCPFIGPLQESLHIPLMQSPRIHTPEGAVAISIGQTVIYPRSTPGGMRIIGRTPVKIFQLEHPDLTLFKPGDKVQFRAISESEFHDLKSKAYDLYEGVVVINVE